MTLEALQALYAEVFASWVRELDLEVRATTADGVTLALPVHARHVHAGGVMCGRPSPRRRRGAGRRAMLLAAP